MILVFPDNVCLSKRCSTHVLSSGCDMIHILYDTCIALQERYDKVFFTIYMCAFDTDEVQNKYGALRQSSIAQI